ncbi:hypothetical protein [Jongsikchunia kroppenstedtii]|uniref:hypothetical protein n=1 Tax=Jongsikchunia kroppenstedtii TaxID=1121721 RepID=UPI00036FE707|nr:hypothetical protein [Jongsikchunia kroppenstedtii]
MKNPFGSDDRSAGLVRIAGFVGVVALAGVAAFGIGRAVGPIHNNSSHDSHSSASTDADMTEGSDMQPGGLAATQDGYTLQLDDRITASSAEAPIRFRIVDTAGAPVTDYQTEHDKELHLIVVRRDLSGYQHLHPVRDAAGTWTTTADLSRAGDYKVFADFAPTGAAGITLGTDLAVGGDYQPVPLPAESATAVVDGYTVQMTGTVAAGPGSMVSFKVTQDGTPVTDLQPYLGAYGHLVALRSTDLAYVHVHPGGAPGDGHTAPGPDVAFHMTAPSAGTYRLFLDFKHGDRVRTAEFTVNVENAPAMPGHQSTSPAPAHHGGH